MTENIYTGFGSHIVLEPQDLGLLDCDKNNASDHVSRWRNLRLQLRYFTIRARPEDIKNHAIINNLRENISCENSAEKVNIMNDERLLVIETKSCDSFHSCKSSVSNKDLSKRPREYGKKNRLQYSRNKLPEEEFHDQITLINAIFLNKKTPKDNQFEIKNENLLSNTNFVDFSIADRKRSFRSDQSSGDRTLVQACMNCKRSSNEKHIENIGTLQNREDHQEYSGIAGTELPHEKPSASKPVFKTFKMNRKTIYGAKKPLMSKITGRKVHHQHKLQPLKKVEMKLPRANMPANETPHLPEDEDELHKGLLLKVKQGINEGYEIHFLEPIRQTDHSVSFGSENAQENLYSDVIHCDEEINSQNKKCEMVDSFNDFEESFLNLFNKLQSSGSSIQPSEDLKETEIIDSGIKVSSDEVNEKPSHNSDLNFELIRDQDSLSSKQSKQGNFKIMCESRTKFPDLSQNETFEILFENESGQEETDNEYLNPVTFEETISEETAVHRSSERAIKNRTEQNMGSETELSTGTLTTMTSSINTHSKRRRSASKKSSLPVIEEIPEPTDIIDNDYCLIDNLNRSIHLFDSQGFPLTDGSGRPLRTAGGELLLKCDDNGIPVVDEETHIYDMFGKQPYEEGFQPWMSPQNSRANRLTLGDGRPLVLFDVEGKPLTSISGTMLVNSYGHSLLKLNCFVQPT